MLRTEADSNIVSRGLARQHTFHVLQDLVKLYMAMATCGYGYGYGYTHTTRNTSRAPAAAAWAAAAAAWAAACTEQASYRQATYADGRVTMCEADKALDLEPARAS